ncbi:MAG: trimeric autotransporter adhesin, partial [Solirubrobacterales bacterium]|nr:trimeric autotransporter adhesin [Solirubrobacterales bacterium]
YKDDKGNVDPGIVANMPAIQRFRTALDAEVRHAFADLGAKYGFKTPIAGGASVAAYRPGDVDAKSPVKDDTLGRTDQVPFVAKGIPGFGVLGAYDSAANQNPAYGLGPLAPLGDGSLVSIPQQAGYDTPRDNVAHFNALTSGTPTPDSIDEPAKRALELPATWTGYLLARQEYSGSAPTPLAPIAYFEALPNAPKAGAPVSFDASAAVDPAGKGLTYTWSFGDGATGSGRTIQHAYAKDGWYDAILVTRDANGHATGYRQSIKVGDTKADPPKTDPCGTVSSAEITRITGQGPGGKAFAKCTAANGFRRVRARRSGAGLAFSFSRRRDRAYSLDVFRTSAGRRLLRNRRVFHVAGTKASALRFTGRGLGDGSYFARATMQLGHGLHDIRRITLRRSHGRFTIVAPHYRRESCGLLSSFKLSEPSFGGRRDGALGVAYRFGSDVDSVQVDLLSGGKRLRRIAAAGREQSQLTYRLRVAATQLGRGTYSVRLTAHAGSRTVHAVLTSRRL